MTKEEIGQILKNLRIASGKTQKEVAEAIGRKQQVVGHWETGYSQPDANTLFVLCDLYDANINDAFGFSEKEWLITARDRAILAAYHANPELQPAIDKMLDIEPEAAAEEKVRVFRAASSEEGKDSEIVDVPRSTIEKLKAAKPADEI